MENLYVTNISIWVILILTTFQVNSFAQINEKDTSTWPEPSVQNINASGFYNSREKIFAYFRWKEKWRADNLPSIYLTEDDTKQLINFLKPHFKLLEGKQKKKIIISQDSLRNLSFTNWKEIELQIKNKENPCVVLEDIAFKIIMVKSNDEHSEYFLTTFTCIEADPLANDDLTDYSIETKGDTITIKFDH